MQFFSAIESWLSNASLFYKTNKRKIFFIGPKFLLINQVIEPYT